MKKLFALSLLAASGLIADQNNNGSMNNNMNQNNNYGNNCCPADCCKPCCVPKPKKCIDCECYTPHFYELQCDWGVSFDIEFLYWYAREGDLSYALKGIAVNQIPTTPGLSVISARSIKHLQSKWDPGFRVGLGWNSDCDGWDWYLTWTYYHNKKHSSTSVPDFAIGGNTTLASVGQEVLVDPWINPAVSETPIIFNSVSAKWRLNMNYIDLELGRKYWLSRCFTMRPYTALRGAWTKLSFRNTATRSSTLTPAINRFRDRFTNRHWGVGFLVGIQPEWYFCRNFVLYTNFDAALIWGKARNRKHENYTTIDAVGFDYHNHLSNNFSKMISILDLAIGLRWDELWCCDRYRTALDVGWEHHTWFDMNNRVKLNSPYSNSDIIVTQRGFQSYTEEYGNLMFGGLVIRLRFDF